MVSIITKMHKNNDIASLMSLLQAGIIEEKTILSQNVTKNEAGSSNH